MALPIVGLPGHQRLEFLTGLLTVFLVGLGVRYALIERACDLCEAGRTARVNAADAVPECQNHS